MVNRSNYEHKKEFDALGFYMMMYLLVDMVIYPVVYVGSK